MPSIDGRQRKALRGALREAFPNYEVLRRLGQDQLDFDLNTRTHAGSGMDTASDEIISEMDQRRGRGGIVQLIEAARAERPEHPLLRQVEQSILKTADPLGDVHLSTTLAPEVAAELATRAGLERAIVHAAGFPRYDDFTSRLGAAEFRVCVVDYRRTNGNRICGTGFLVADDLLMTNHHVIDFAASEKLAGTAIELMFGFRSHEANRTRYTLVQENWLVAFAPTESLDYAIVRVEGSPGSDPVIDKGTVERGNFNLVNNTLEENEPLIILQHPYDSLEGGPAPLRLTIGFNMAHKDAKRPFVFSHSANTDEGSSGSPVFSGRMHLIGLHNWGGPNHNEAIRAGAIRDHLAANGHSALLE